MNSETTAREYHRSTVPRIFVVSWADHIAGRSHGRWIDADQPVNAIREQIAVLLADSPEVMAEKWAIHAYENFGTLRLSESEDLEHLAHVGRMIVEHGPVFAELVNHFGGVSAVDRAKECMELDYLGAFSSMAECGRALVEEFWTEVLEGLPNFLEDYIDYEGYGQHLESTGGVFTIEEGGKIHAFGGSG